MNSPQPDTTWSGKQVLVTGGAGFLGAHLVHRLAMLGATVHATSRRPIPASSNSSNVAWHQVELSSAEDVQHVVAEVQPEVLFHMAGFAKAARDMRNVLPALEGDLLTTVNVLLAATEFNCGRVVVTGSLEEPAGGGSDLVPSSPYAAAKWAGAAYARMFHELYATPVVIARHFMTYGPGQRAEKIIPYVVRSLLDNKAPRLASADRLVDWIYVDDAIEALLALGTREEIDGQTFDIGSGTLVSIRDLVNRLVELTGATVRPDFGALPTPQAEVVQMADAEHTAARLGWRATTPLDVGLAKTVQWYATPTGGTRGL